MGARRSPLRVPTHDPASCTLEVRHEVLAGVPFFAGLDHADIVELDRRCRIEDFDTGQAVIHAGQPARRLYVVATGTAKVVRPTLAGTEVLLDIVRPGDHFGTLPTLGADTYADSVWALTPLCVLSLDGPSFDAVLDAHPEVARAGLRVMAERLEAARTHVHAMAVATSQERVALAVAILARRVGVPHDGGMLLDLPLSRDDLAAMTGTASETVSRVLAQLQRDGVIDSGRQWIVVRDLARLDELAQI
jgi:CRP-like cAMP-binding protein